VTCLSALAAASLQPAPAWPNSVYSRFPAPAGPAEVDPARRYHLLHEWLALRGPSDARPEEELGMPELTSQISSGHPGPATSCGGPPLRTRLRQRRGSAGSSRTDRCPQFPSRGAAARLRSNCREIATFADLVSKND